MSQLTSASIVKPYTSSPNQVLTHAARAAAKVAFQPPLVAARGAREGLWLEQIYQHCQASKTAFRSHCARPTVRYILCERGVLSEFRAARICASYWLDKFT